MSDATKEPTLAGAPSIAGRPMNRRAAIAASGSMAAGAWLASGILLAACSRDPKNAAPDEGSLAADDVQLMEQLADTLLPTTPSSPGAAAAGAGAIMALLVTDCYEEGAVERVREGLSAVRTRCESACGGPFTKLSPSQREKLVKEIDAEAVAAGEEHWFHLMRRLALQAYFSTETGMTQALRYIRVPGHWTGCLPLEPGQPAWA